MGKMWKLKLVFGSVVNLIYLKFFCFLCRFLCIFTKKKVKNTHFYSKMA